MTPLIAEAACYFVLAVAFVLVVLDAIRDHHEARRRGWDSVPPPPPAPARRRIVAPLTLLPLVMAALPAAALDPTPHVEGWMKRSQSYHRFAGSEFAERSQQWQGSVVGRIPVWDRLQLVARLDTKPQSGEFVFTDSGVWQSLEAVAGPRYRLKEAGPLRETEKGDIYQRFELGLVAVGGLALELGDAGADRVKVNAHPSLLMGGVYLSDRSTGAYFYGGVGFHEAVNGRAVAAMATLHVPLSTEKAALDVDVVWGLMDALRPLAPGEVTRAGTPAPAGIRGQRVVVSISAQVFSR